jgi:hypothetical protein
MPGGIERYPGCRSLPFELMDFGHGDAGRFFQEHMLASGNRGLCHQIANLWRRAQGHGLDRGFAREHLFDGRIGRDAVKTGVTACRGLKHEAAGAAN